VVAQRHRVQQRRIRGRLTVDHIHVLQRGEFVHAELRAVPHDDDRGLGGGDVLRGQAARDHDLAVCPQVGELVPRR
jgi:hypothetical protein